MEGCRECNVCDKPGRIEDAPECAEIPSNVREFHKERFTVWRCGNCGSLHCLEGIDAARYYRAYPLQRQQLDFFTRRMLASRLSPLVRQGLRKEHTVLDYGCGNGGFVRFLHQRGYPLAQGYDPFSRDYADPAVLKRRYHFVLAQDVIEHVDDPRSLLDTLATLVSGEGGTLVVGTPDAQQIRLNDPTDAVGQLHQPYHRHILSGAQLQRLLQERGFAVTYTAQRWYVDTPWPFLNSRFVLNYLSVTGGCIDASFEPIRFSLVLRSPHLLSLGILGGMFAPRKDILVFARSALT